MAAEQELYPQHRVVAYPARGRLCSRDSTGIPQQPRPRSLSAGRLVRRSANDIVQDVYDRMGIQRVAAADEKASDVASFQERYRAAALRGREMVKQDDETPSPRRSRSLSRGRVWPPAKEADGSNPSSSSPQRKAQSTSSPFRRTKSSVSESSVSQVSAEGATEEEVDTTRVASNLSVKDRISLFGGTKTNPKNYKSIIRNPSYAVKLARQRDHPPKIDIYPKSRDEQEEKKDEEKPEDSSGQSSSHSSVPDVEEKRKPKNITDNFLGAAAYSYNGKKKLKPPPPIEISDEAGDVAAVDSASILSSVSGDEYAATRSTRTEPVKRPSWLMERNTGNRVTAYHQPRVSPTNNDAMMMEKMIEERVQAQMAVLETRMEQKMARFMQQMEERVNALVQSQLHQKHGEI